MNLISNNTQYKENLKNRFVKYVQIWSESNGEQADKGIFPSTPQQWDMAHTLEAELKSFGLSEVQVTENCYVYGFLPGNCEKQKPVLFLAHMDTVDEVTGQNVKPQLGKVSAREGVTENLYRGVKVDDGDIIISSDGSTLLGGDDKAGVAAIMTMLEYLVQNPNIKHCPIEVIFSPDEETGHGMDRVPMDLIKADHAYTVDGSNEGEMETECFNAWSATVDFTGKACHTGDAKAGGMINANLMAADFINRLPENMRPETTEHYEGFIAVMGVGGTIESSTVEMLLRSFNIEEINEEKKIVQKAARATEEKFGGNAQVFFDQQYLNMKEKMDKAPEVVAKLEKAYKAAGVEIVRKPIRGGTDGSRLTEMGIPTPNIFTGAHEYHSRNEWVSLNQMSKAADILLNLVID